jgi:Mn-dependent DtxR family transcriptional regulator
MRTKESEEMYLETILLIKNRKPEIHSVDIIEDLGYVKSSVSRAVNLLRDKGYITIDVSGEIKLTDIGYKKATDIYERHCVITEALIKIGADKAEAEANACKIEHVITPEMFEIIKKFVE